MMVTGNQKLVFLALLVITVVAIYVTTEIKSVMKSYEELHVPLDLKNLVDNNCDNDDDGFLRGPPKQDDPRVLEALRKNFLIPPPTNPNKHMIVQNGDHVWKFYEYYNKLLLGNQKTGFFLEAGALQGDALSGSNSLFLEIKKGWTGILVEVDTENFEKLKEKRRNAWLSNTCISGAPYPQMLLFEFLSPPKVNPNHFIHHKANSRAANSPFSKRKGPIDTKSEITLQDMQCFPLGSYLLALNVTTLDYLSLDIQGFEWDVIRSFPFDKITIRVIAVEYLITLDDGKPGQVYSPEFVAYMDKIGYYLVDNIGKIDYVFALKKDPIFKALIGENKYAKFKG